MEKLLYVILHIKVKIQHPDVCWRKGGSAAAVYQEWSALCRVEFAMQDCGRSWQLLSIIFLVLLYSNRTTFSHFFQQMHNFLPHIRLSLKQILDLQKFIKVVHFQSGMRFAVG